MLRLALIGLMLHGSAFAADAGTAPTKTIEKLVDVAKKVVGDPKKTDGDPKKTDGDPKKTDGKKKKADGDAKQADAETKAADKPKYTPKEAKPLPKLTEDGGRGLRALVIPIEGTIDLGLAPFVKRALEQNQGAAVLILDVDTFGGRVDAAVKIRDAVLAAKIPTVAFVNRRAISAGALISLAADHIVFAPGGSMGAATPVQVQGGKAEAVGEKMVSYMRAEMRATAEANGRDGDLAEAMVDADVEIPGYLEKGKLLTASTDQALELGLATQKLDTLNDLMRGLGLEFAEVVRPSTNWAERVARFLTDPVVSGLLMSIGMLGLLLELYTPGFGFAGGIGMVCLLLFFGGHAVVDLAGWEEVVVFIVGIGLLAAEIFVIPGFGVAGVAGIALVVIALSMALMGMPVGVAWDTGAVNSALTAVMLSLLGSMAAMLVLMRFLPQGRLGRWLVLQTTLGTDDTATSDESWQSAPSEWAQYVGMTGVAATDLRPSGKVRIDGKLVDVVSQGEIVDKGDPVVVIEVEGVRVVVARVEQSEG